MFSIILAKLSIFSNIFSIIKRNLKLKIIYNIPKLFILSLKTFLLLIKGNFFINSFYNYYFSLKYNLVLKIQSLTQIFLVYAIIIIL